MAARPRLDMPRGLERGDQVHITVDGHARTAYLGESVAAVLIADGELTIRTTIGGDPRGMFCGMGTCFDCLVIVDGVPGTRSCITWVSEGMDIARQSGHGERLM